MPSHSSISPTMMSQKGLTPSARGTGHFMVTEMAGPGVAQENILGGVIAEKDAVKQVRKRSPIYLIALIAVFVV